MIHQVFKAVANSTFERECPYEGRQRFFFGVCGSGRRPFKCVTLNMLRMLHYMWYILCMMWTLCRFYVLYVLYTCMLRLLYMLCAL